MKICNKYDVHEKLYNVNYILDSFTYIIWDVHLRRVIQSDKRRFHTLIIAVARYRSVSSNFIIGSKASWNQVSSF